MALNRTLLTGAIVEGDQTPTYTVPGDSLAVVLITWDADGDTPAAASLGGNAMTQVLTSGASPINFPVKMWVLNDPPTGAQEVTFGTAMTYRGTTAMYSYDTNLDITTPVTDVLNDGGASPAADMTVAKAAGDHVIIAASLLDIGGGSAPAVTGTSGVAEEDSAAVDTLGFAGLAYYSGSATSVSAKYDAAGSTEEYYCQGAFVVKEAAGSTSYTITAESASVSVTGTDANLEHHREVAAESASVAITGTDAALRFDRLIGAESAAYALTPTDAGLEYGLTLAAEAAAYALTPTDVALLYHRALDLESAAYTLSGTDATLRFGYALLAESLAVAITPTDAFFDLVRFAQTIAYAITPTDANLEHHRALDLESAAYALTPTDAGLEFHRALDLESAAYVITGTDAALSTGADVTLVAESAAYSVTPTDVSLLRGLRLVAESGAVVATGQDAALLASLLLTAEIASVTITPQDVELASGFRVLAESAAFSLTPTNAGLVYDRALDLGSLAILLTATDATLTYDGAPLQLVPTLDRIATALGRGVFVTASNGHGFFVRPRR